MNLKLEGCSNPGLSFTPFRINQILEIAEWIDNKSNVSKMKYTEIQMAIENDDNSLDNSSVRMIIPFLKKIGYIEKSWFTPRNQLIDLNKFFTSEGKFYVEFLRLYQKIYKLNDEKIIKEMDKANQSFIIFNIINLIINGESSYIDTMEFLQKYRTMDKNEFFLMTTLRKKYSGENYDKMLFKAINKYREGAFKRIKIVNNANCYGYITSILKESGLCVDDSSGLILNNNYSSIIQIILKQRKGEKENE